MNSNRKRRFEIDANTYRKVVEQGDKEALDEIRDKEPIPKFFKWVLKK